MLLFGFILRHLPIILAIIVFTLFTKFSFVKMFLFMWIVGALYEAFLWQLAGCIEIRIPIPSQRTNLEHDIIRRTITIKNRIIYFIWRLYRCLFDKGYIIGALVVSGLFTLGYSIITR